MSAPLLVVVTGPPAGGKSSLAEGLAERLRLPLLAKDDVKEALFDSLGAGDRDWSRRLGTATFKVLFVVAERLLAAGTDLVLEANLYADEAEGDLEAVRRRTPFRLVQVYCGGDPDRLVERFAGRAQTGERHPGHVDDDALDDVVRGLREGRWRPLSLDGALIEVDTTSGDVDAAALAARIDEQRHA